MGRGSGGCIVWGVVRGGWWERAHLPALLHVRLLLLARVWLEHQHEMFISEERAVRVERGVGWGG